MLITIIKHAEEPASGATNRCLRAAHGTREGAEQDDLVGLKSLCHLRGGAGPPPELCPLREPGGAARVAGACGVSQSCAHSTIGETGRGMVSISRADSVLNLTRRLNCAGRRRPNCPTIWPKYRGGRTHQPPGSAPRTLHAPKLARITHGENRERCLTPRSSPASPTIPSRNPQAEPQFGRKKGTYQSYNLGPSVEARSVKLLPFQQRVRISGSIRLAVRSTTTQARPAL